MCVYYCTINWTTSIMNVDVLMVESVTGWFYCTTFLFFFKLRKERDSKRRKGRGGHCDIDQVDDRNIRHWPGINKSRKFREEWCVLRARRGRKKKKNIEPLSLRLSFKNVKTSTHSTQTCALNCIWMRRRELTIPAPSSPRLDGRAK